MCKQRALYYCPECLIYISSSEAKTAGDPPRPVCSSCGGPLLEAQPRGPAGELWCPRCERPIDQADAIPADGAKPVSCSSCGTALVAPLTVLDNPVDIGAGLKLIGLIARLLVKTGALDALEDYAKGSPTRLDDIAARVARAIVMECSRL